MGKKLVIFDFDGVLADTLEFAFKVHKDLNGNLTWEKFQDFSIGNFHEKMDKAVKEEAYVIPSNFEQYYEENLAMIGIKDVLRNTIFELKDTFTLAIVSSTNSSHIANFLKKEKMFDCFSEILGTDVHRNKAYKINSILQKYRIDQKNVVFVTDSLGDVLEANECKIYSIGVTWGLHDKKTLKNGKPTAIIDDPRDLFKTIQGVLK